MPTVSEYASLFVDHDRYPLAGDTTAELARDFAERHHVVLPGFLTGNGLAVLRKEVERLRRYAVRKEFLMECMGDSPRRLNTLGSDVIEGLSTILPGLYQDSYLIGLLSSIYGERVEALVDDIDRYVVNCLQATADTFGAHFDDFPISFVLIVSAPPLEDGGYPELVPNARSLEELEGPGAVRVALRDGDAYLLKADTTAHRVAPLRRPTDRIAVNLTSLLSKIRSR